MYQPYQQYPSSGHVQQQQPFSPSLQPSPAYPSPPSDPYRASPISMQARSPYTSALSPPPSMGMVGPGPGPVYSSMPKSGSSSLSLHPHPHPQYASRSGGARYPNYSSSSNSNGGSPSGFSSSGIPALPIPPQQTPQQKFKGTLAPGTIIKVGDNQVRIERYLSEGGYAHVYLTSSERPVYPPAAGVGKSRNGDEGESGAGQRNRWGEKGYTQHCLKRIAFEDEKVWVDVRKEIEVMKALPPSPHLTQYLASAHSRLPSGGYEVFILMEFCSGGGIIDLLNKRLRDRLKEIEILNIFTDVCEAVAAMHFLKQPLLHRDLKIENVLSAPTGQQGNPQRPTPLIFKLCDFGSTTFPSTHPPQNKIEAEALAMDLNKHTTLQYRSPEMVEPMLGWAVGLPSDVWALGVLLYKLCYYTTPFEEHGTLAIVNAKYTFPQYPVYSPRIQHLIASMLVDHPARRPSVFEVLRVAHEMSGTRPEIDYPIPSQPFPLSPQQSSKPKTNSTNLLDFTSPSPTAPAPATMQPDLAASVQPQRRGRPGREPSQKAIPTLPSGLPPMPQPPAIPSAEVKATAPKIQVTGEQPKPSSQTSQTRQTDIPTRQPSKDAFGAPKTASGGAAGPTKAGDGFGDAFGMTQQSNKLPGFGKNFVGAPVKTWSASSGFSDSFAVRSGTGSGSGSAPLSALNGVGRQAAFTPTQAQLPRVASPETMMRPSPSQAVKGEEEEPNGDADLSFETRFPSLDMLESESDETPIQRPETSKSVSDLISPITSPPPIQRPPVQSKASMMGHLTGDMAAQHQSIASRVAGGPLPRSTQVTGTAFKGVSSPVLRAEKEGYFASASMPDTASTTKTAQPVDLMTGDAYSSMTSTSRQNSVRQETTKDSSFGESGSSRPSLPNIVVGTSDRSIATIGRSPENSSSMTKRDSSDEEAEPESASGTGRRPYSPSKRQGGMSSSTSFSDRRAAFESTGAGSTAPPRDKSPTKQSSNPSIAPKPAGISGLRGSTAQRARPQSMFIPSSAAAPLVSPTAGAEPSSASSLRPSHHRKGSIGDMVTKYEALQSPSSEIGQEGSAGSSAGKSPVEEKPLNGLARKPSVASKPQNLRKPVAAPKPAFPRSSSPEKSAVSEEASVSTSITAEAPSSNSIKPVLKPAVAPKPSRHGDMPTVAGYSRSSSGRSFPISKAAPTSISETTEAVKPTMEAAAKSGSRQTSPDKQQSVGSLIARWNLNK